MPSRPCWMNRTHHRKNWPTHCLAHAVNLDEDRPADDISVVALKVTASRKGPGPAHEFAPALNALGYYFAQIKTAHVSRFLARHHAFAQGIPHRFGGFSDCHCWWRGFILFHRSASRGTCAKPQRGDLHCSDTGIFPTTRGYSPEVLILKLFSSSCH